MIPSIKKCGCGNLYMSDDNKCYDCKKRERDEDIVLGDEKLKWNIQKRK